jgi:hypothetical protein
MNPLVMSYCKIRFNIVLVSMTSFQILLLQFCMNFFSFSCPDSSVGILVGERVFSFCKIFGPALGPTQLPTQWIPGKSIRVVRFTTRLQLVPKLWMSGAVSLFPPYAFMAWTGPFSHLSHARYMPRPSCNEVAIQCEATVIRISASCFLPGPHIQPPHHSALQPPQSASPTHHASFVYRDNIGEGNF